MKTTTVNSIKFLKLKRRLALPHWQAIGLLEAVWMFCMVNAQDGGIGRHSNEDIAAALEWDGDADELIRNLVETGWLEEHPEVRLCVHDWEDHVPNFVKAVMAKQGKKFIQSPSELATQVAPVGNSGGPSRQPELPTRVGNSGGPSRQPYNITKPNITKPNTKNPPTPLRGESPPPSQADPEPPPTPDPEPSPEPLGEPDEEAACAQAQGTATAVEVLSPEAELAHAWTTARQGVGWRVPSGETYAELMGFFAEKIRLGKDPQWVAARIADPGRDRTEKLWQFARRELEEKHPNKPRFARDEPVKPMAQIMAEMLNDPAQKRTLEVAFHGYAN